MKLRLVVLTPGKWEGKTIPIGRPQFLIGRDAGCHLRPSSAIVSKRHCELVVRDATVAVRDFNSSNGTFVNDRQVQGEIELQHNDTLKVGPLEFRVQIEPGASAADPAPAGGRAGSADPSDPLLVPWEESGKIAGDELPLGDEEVPEGSTERHLPDPVVTAEKPVTLPEKAKFSSAWLEIRERSTVTIVRFTARSILDDHTIQAIGRQLSNLADRMDIPFLLLDFKGVGYLSSSMIGKVVALQKKAQAAKGRLVLCGLSAELFKVFDLTNLTQMLTIREDESEALELFESPS